MDHAKPRELPVRRRRILTGSGEAATTRTVLCPAHGDAVTVSLCADCARCLRIENDASGPSNVVCVPALGPEPHSGWSKLVHRILPSAADRVPIADAMAREVNCVTTDVGLESLQALFVDEGVAAVPVVDADAFPIGIVSKSDLVRVQYENGDTEATATLGEGMHETPARPTVADVMTPIAYTLRETDPLSRAAAVMAMENVHQLPVVDGEGRVVGMIESLDFVRWIASQSAYADEA